MEPIAQLRHDVGIAPIPELVAMGEIASHALAGRFDNVCADRLRVPRRQFTVPEDDFGFVNRAHGAETITSASWRSVGRVTACPEARAATPAPGETRQSPPRARVRLRLARESRSSSPTPQNRRRTGRDAAAGALPRALHRTVRPA